MLLMMHHGTLAQRSGARLGQERSRRWIHWLPGHFHRASFIAAVWLAAMSGVLFPDAAAQRAGEEDESSAPTIDAATGKILNEAIELMNAEDYRGAQEAVCPLKLDRLSPYERSPGGTDHVRHRPRPARSRAITQILDEQRRALLAESAERCAS